MARVPDGASEQAEESKLALTLQVRHHWTLAVMVALLGAAMGWFVNKFAQGYRTGRRLLAEGRRSSMRPPSWPAPSRPEGDGSFPARPTRTRSPVSASSCIRSIGWRR